jgi:hypothetical protein
LLGVGAKGTSSDNRIDGIGIHIGYGKEIPMNTDRSALLGRNPTELLGILRLACGAESHRMRKYRCAKQTSGQNPLLKVCCNEKRQPRFSL